jgi:hypothetical protein
MQMNKILLCIFLLSCNQPEIPIIKINLDYSETPHLKEWGKDAQQLLLKWVPQIGQILDENNIPDEINLVIQNSDEGIAYADSNKIVVSSHWIEKYPEDIGLIVHEGVHVVQMYPNFEPGWLTEGIADYVRWHLYEEKPLEWLPMSKNEKGWEDAYRVTGGFLLWLVKDKNTNIIKKLNLAMKTNTYNDSIFINELGDSLFGLWQKYEINKTSLAK